MNDIKVLFNFNAWNEFKDYFKLKLAKYPNLKLIFPSEDELENINDFAAEADVLFGWRPTIELLESAKKMQLYINPGTGVEGLLKVFNKYSRINEVILLNGHGHSYETAQHTVSLLLSQTNKVVPHHNLMTNGIWRRKDPTSHLLKKKLIGLLGYGAINQQVHKFLSGFSLTFSILTRTKFGLDLPENVIDSYTSKDIHEFLKKIDVLIVAIPLTANTENLITSTEFKLMKKDIIIINVGRGPIINQGDLFNFLKINQTASAGIDTWYNYDPDKINDKQYPYDLKYPFHNLENIILSPHRAGSPMSHISRWDEHIENLIKFAEGNVNLLNNVVDKNEGY